MNVAYFEESLEMIENYTQVTCSYIKNRDKGNNLTTGFQC